MWIPILGLIIGLVLGMIIPADIVGWDPQLLTILVISTADSLFNGFVSKLNNKFNTLLFSMEFLLNTLFAIGLIYLGLLMKIDLFFAIIIIFGLRMFYNLTEINHKLFIRR